MPSCVCAYICISIYVCMRTFVCQCLNQCMCCVCFSLLKWTCDAYDYVHMCECVSMDWFSLCMSSLCVPMFMTMHAYAWIPVCIQMCFYVPMCICIWGTCTYVHLSLFVFFACVHTCICVYSLSNINWNHPEWHVFGMYQWRKQCFWHQGSQILVEITQ